MTATAFPNELIRASAGSGKTYELTNRYLGLLASGAAPDVMLATTFTRKAAGEILDRVLQRLAQAANDPGMARTLALQLQLPETSSAAFISLLRSVLQNLHRVRIDTLDSFFMSVAGSFSLELALPAGWSICENTDDIALRQEALSRLLEQQPDRVAALLPLLNRDETARSVQENLTGVIRKHYEHYCGSDRAAWHALRPPAGMTEEQRASTLDQFRAFDFASCGTRFATARDEDTERFESGAWSDFLDTGLAAKIRAGEGTYYRKAIPPEAVRLYNPLIQHAKGELLRRLAEQTQATWELLDHFHRELSALKQATGGYRFGEVTQAIVNAMRGAGPRREPLSPDRLAFRLDGSIDHLLLDEFQDTALAQWRVLEPIAGLLTTAPGDVPGSFFCVGDTKQAIYAWRGGMAEILDSLPVTLGALTQRTLQKSYRSAQPVIDAVNQVFQNLDQFRPGAKYHDGIDAWGRRYQEHTTAKTGFAGYVCLQSGPAQQEGQRVMDQRRAHCEFVSHRIEDITKSAPGRAIGVLCRTNEMVARIIYELRQRGLDASEEGGNAVTDAPAVALMLSLFTLADHPEHSAAWFHLQNSPLQIHVKEPNPETLAGRIRRELLDDGYGAFTYAWAQRLAPACGKRDLSRLQQLVEIAFAYQTRATLRCDDFVAWVEGQHVSDPSNAKIRVMTIHSAKGLQFPIVVLPELESRLVGSAPALVLGRDAKSLEARFACRYASETVQGLLEPDQRESFAVQRQHEIEESLSLLYVAMTRAEHALYLFVPGPRKPAYKFAWYCLLMHTLAAQKKWEANAVLYEHGDVRWFEQLPQAAAAPVVADAAQGRPIEFSPALEKHKRGLQLVAPSSREGEARVSLKRVFETTDSDRLAAGTLYHAWFETIAWLEDGTPTKKVLDEVVEALASKLPAKLLDHVPRLLAEFQGWLKKPALHAALCRAAYASPGQPGFPSGLVRIWTPALKAVKVERERRFLVRDGASFLNGSLDRVVWLGEGERILAADVLDFKTDAVTPGDEAALKERAEHYRPQLQAYRRAVALLADLPLDHITTRLLFTTAGRVVEIP